MRYYTLVHPDAGSRPVATDRTFQSCLPFHEHHWTPSVSQHLASRDCILHTSPMLSETFGNMLRTVPSSADRVLTSSCN